MHVAPSLLALVLASVALASPPVPHNQHHIFAKGPHIRGPKVIRHLIVPPKFSKHPQFIPAASRQVLKRHHFPSSAPFAKGSTSCSDCSKQGSWKPIIPPQKAYKSIAPVFDQQPLLQHPVHIESHPAHFHIQIERFPGADESSPPANVQFNSSPWGGDGGSSQESGGYSGGSSGSAESSEHGSDENQFYKAGPPVQLQLNNHADEPPAPPKGSKDYAVHEQVDEPPPPPRRTPKGGIQLPFNIIPTPPPPSSPPAPVYKSSFFRRRRQPKQHPNVQIIPSRNVRVIHLKS